MLCLATLVSLTANFLCLSYEFDWGTAPLWIGSGLYLIFLEIFPKSRHSYIYLGILLGNFIGNLYWDIHGLKALAYAAINVFEAFLIWNLLLKHPSFKTKLPSLISTVRFLLTVAIVTAFIGVLGAVITRFENDDVDFFSQWLIWALDDFTGIIIIYPFYVFHLTKSAIAPELSSKRIAEISIFTFLCGITMFYFIPFAPQRYAFLEYWYWPFPLSLWLTLRFSRQFTWAVFAVGLIIAAISTRMGFGLFPTGNSSVVTLTIKMQLYMSALMIPCLMIQSLKDEMLVKIKEIQYLCEKAESAKKEAEQANTAKSLFVANVSHELRTPLTAIIGFCELIQKSDLSDENAFFLAKIAKNSKDLNYIVEDLLQLTSEESNETRITPSLFSLRELANDLELLFAQQNKRAGVKFEVTCRPSDKIEIYSDYIRITQIASNLVRNSIKFTESGKIEVTISVHKAGTESTKMLRVLVNDTGIGFKMSEAEKIFQPFKQLDESRTRKYGGTGLGLYISRKIAQALGGDIRLIWSEPNVGSAFEAWIPIKPTPLSLTQPRFQIDENLLIM